MNKWVSTLVCASLTAMATATVWAQQAGGNSEPTEQQRLRSFSPGGPLTPGI